MELRRASWETKCYGAGQMTWTWIQRSKEHSNMIYNDFYSTIYVVVHKASIYSLFKCSCSQNS